ncbi:hypothetical protein ACIPYS_03315 [Kitasatospora sp. NPDC089913]|uniref:hypothetical protein n=1 Tax=Kitasatospora sp. NPDC089913 TaxID=3364080 RepID=UPI00382D43DD
MRGIVVRTLVAVMLGTGAWWGGAAAALAADSGPGPAVTATPGGAHGAKPGNADKPGRLDDRLGDLLDLDGRDGHGGADSGRQCSVTTAWGDSWCPRKPLD